MTYRAKDAGNGSRHFRDDHADTLVQPTQAVVDGPVLTDVVLSRLPRFPLSEPVGDLRIVLSPLNLPAERADPSC